MSERPPIDVPKSRELLEGLLTLAGSTGETYSRFHRYSPRNLGFLALQNCPPEPIATFKRWQELGRHVTKGSKAYSILRPIQVKVETDDNSDEQYKLVRRFKVVRALFAVSQTAGDDLPPYCPPGWSVDRALETLGIERVPFENYDGNIGGYARGNKIAINPVAPYPLRTTIHEASHVTHGDTTPENLALYQEHRGQFEYRAEASAYVVLNELGALDEETASVSRGYVQGWLRDQQPPEDDMRRVLNVSTKILDAGFEPEGTEES
ncbi:DNA primase [Arthrobacter sp. Hiyo8]|uniref:ArdC-like ssDNA-binding domain-containing protein n=1 Tax=Arthrobacter sp. Hiyo1 TaxID=1588020 RepID=UPI00068392F6|nr:ArdC-like ssDNA-binding domain-containing protein [Arthrobacter sp. Hiyo1]BAS17606.1 DNA primase [Arthrobacter sp. Hiyo8]GAP57964.1 DNA primase [Arthrobacter sp. Hiyo1]